MNRFSQAVQRAYRDFAEPRSYLLHGLELHSSNVARGLAVRGDPRLPCASLSVFPVPT